MTGRELLLALGPVLAPAREIRYRDSADFEDVSTGELEVAARNLRAISYSCKAGALKLELLADTREGEG